MFISFCSIEFADDSLGNCEKCIEKGGVNIYRKTENCYTRGSLKCNPKINFVPRGFQI